MSQRIFVVGRARRRLKKAAVRPASSLAAAGRRLRRPRVPSAAPTLTSLAMVAGWVSTQRIAGDGEFARQERAASLQRATDRSSFRPFGADSRTPTFFDESPVQPVAFAPAPLVAAPTRFDPAHYAGTTTLATAP